MSRWSRAIHSIQQEIKAFLFMTAMIMLFRLLFIACYSYQLESIPIKEILSAIWLGFRISLKTVGFMTLLSILLISIPHVFRPTWPAEKLRNIWYGFLIVLSTFLFCGRIPFYYIFQSGYNMMLINGVHDDIGATIATAIHEYHAIPILIGAVLIAALLCWLFLRIMAKATKTLTPPKSKKQWRLTIGIGILLFFTIAIFFRFGGAFTYKRSIHWESAARTSSNLLNEAILDDMQALYRVKSIATRIKKADNIQLSPSQVDERIIALGGNPAAPTIDLAFTKTIPANRLESQPNSIYIILGESYGAWPLLDEYDNLGQYITQYGKQWVQSTHSITTTSALAPGSGTISAVNGLVTGLVETGLYPNYESVTFHDTYGTGLGPVMKGLGYKTVFWYGGFSTWQNIKNFVLAQGFDEFHDASEMQSSDKENAWGVPDQILFDTVEQYMNNHRGEKIINVILTTSNHPPYSIPVDDLGYDREKVATLLPDSIKGSDKNLTELGHIWYADQTMGHFVEHIEKADPSALFVITGDHSERFAFARDVSIREKSAIPLIIYGNHIQPNWFTSTKPVLTIQLVPTLAELVGRQGDHYVSMVPSIFNDYDYAFNHELWANHNGIYSQKTPMPADLQQLVNYSREVSTWRIKHGNNK